MTGICRFCGQVLEIGDHAFQSEEQKNEAASACCGCAGSRAYALRKKKIDTSVNNIQLIADEENISEDMHDILNRMSVSLIDYSTESCSIRFPDFSLKLKRNNDGDVVVEKTRTQKKIYL